MPRPFKHVRPTSIFTISPKKVFMTIVTVILSGQMYLLYTHGTYSQAAHDVEAFVGKSAHDVEALVGKSRDGIRRQQSPSSKESPSSKATPSKGAVHHDHDHSPFITPADFNSFFTAFSTLPPPPDSLFPHWSILLKLAQTNLSPAKPRVPQHVYFKHVDMTQDSLATDLGPARFFLPVEDTLPEADYVMEHDMSTLQAWSAALSGSTGSQNCLAVGPGSGFFSLFSRSLGCRVLAVDSRPLCLARLSAAASLNAYGQEGDFEVKWAAETDDLVDTDKCESHWSTKGGTASSTTTPPVKTMGDIISEWLGPDPNVHLHLFKIDEGYSSIAILKSCLPHFASRRINHVALTVAPSSDTAAAASPVLAALYSHGYTVTDEVGDELTQEDALARLSASGSDAPITVHICADATHHHAAAITADPVLPTMAQFYDRLASGELVPAATHAAALAIGPKSAPQPGLPYSHVSFFWFDLTPAGLGPSLFFYPVEETMHSARYIAKNELNTLRVWAKALLGGRHRIDNHRWEPYAPGAQKNCLDVGSNGGFFSMLSLALGCNTMAVDAQPWCLARLSSGAAVNGFGDDLAITWAAVSDDPALEIAVGTDKCSGLWSVDEKETDHINKESSGQATVKSKRIDAILSAWLPDPTSKVHLFKIDVEGSEIAVLLSCLPYFEAQRIENVLVEITPALSTKTSSMEGCDKVINTLYDSGYTIDEIGKNSMQRLNRAQALSFFHDTEVEGRGAPENFHIHLLEQ